MQMTPKEYAIGKVGYVAYCQQTGGKSLISGDPLPPFEELKQSIKDAWAAVGVAIILDREMVERGMWPEH